MFTKILVPLDMHEPEVGRQAVDAAVALARAFDGQVRFVHVASPISPVPPSAAIPQRYFDELGEPEGAALETFATALGLPADRVTTTVRVGAVYPELLAEADEWGADLIVIGAHSRSIATVLLGSTADALSRHAKCTVMIARSPLKAKLL